MSHSSDAPVPGRRAFLGLALLAVALVAAPTGRAAEPLACDAEDDDEGRAAMRASLEYASPSKTAGKVCGGCAFFKTTAPKCGSCQLLNGPVTPDAVCSSWAPKK